MELRGIRGRREAGNSRNRCYRLRLIRRSRIPLRFIRATQLGG